jgi:hypothetical protein
MANESDSSSLSDEIDLHLSFEVSSLEDYTTEDMNDIAPYQFEPAKTDSDDSNESNEQDTEPGQNRLGNTEW